MDDVTMTGLLHTFTTPKKHGAPKIQLSVPLTVGQPCVRETYRNAIFFGIIRVTGRLIGD